MLDIEVIRSFDKFESIEKEWNILISMAGQDSPFLRHEWFRCCWIRQRKNLHPLIIVIKDRQRIIAAAPLIIRTEKMKGFPVKRVLFLRCPDTFVTDFIILDREEEVIKSFIDFLFQKEIKWDIISLSDMPQKSRFLNVFPKVAKREKINFCISPWSKLPYLSMRNDTWASFYAKKSQKFKKTNRNIMNRISRLGSVEVKEISQMSDTTKQNLLASIFGISINSWKGRDGVALSIQEGSSEFFSELTDIATQRGWLKIWLLSMNNRPIAMEYQLEYNQIIYALRADFDEEYSQYSPGSYLNSYIIQQLFNKGYPEYNMGPGLNSYKLQWTDNYYGTFCVDIYHPSIYGKTLYYLREKILPRIRNSNIIKYLGNIGKRS